MPSYFLSTLFSKRFLVFVRKFKKKKKSFGAGFTKERERRKEQERKEGRLKDTGDIIY